ncbi:hypothetical protein ACLMJK_000865 [Lecanora helva]
MKVLIIGAAGRVGSAALAACLHKNDTVTAFLRFPSKLPPELRDHPSLSVIQGDVTSHGNMVEALRDQDAVIQCAAYCSTSPFGASDSERVVRCIIEAIKEVQSTRPRKMRPIKFWVMSGQVLVDIPGYRGKTEADVFPVHPKHYKDYEFLQKDGFLSLGKIDSGEVRVVLYQVR